MNALIIFTYSLFISSDVYQKIFFKWKAFHIKYLLIIMLLASSPIFIKIFYIVHSVDIKKIQNSEFKEINEKNNINHIIAEIIDQIPTISIVNGDAQTTQNKIYYVYFPHTENIIALINTSDLTLSEPDKNVPILITKKELIIKNMNNNNSSTSYDLYKIFSNQVTVDKESIFAFLNKAIRIAYLILFFIYLPLLVASIFFFFLLKSLALSIVGAIFFKFNNIKYNYAQVIRISLYAGVPAIIIGFVLACIPIHSLIMLKLREWIVFFSSISYFIFAIMACKKTKI